MKLLRRHTTQFDSEKIKVHQKQSINVIHKNEPFLPRLVWIPFTKRKLECVIENGKPGNTFINAKWFFEAEEEYCEM